MNGLIFAGGQGTRMSNYIRRVYGKHINKVLIPVGIEQKPILHYTLKEALSVLDWVYVLCQEEDVHDFASEYRGAIPMLHPDTGGRAESLEYCLKRGFLQPEDLVTLNAVDLIDSGAIGELSRTRGNSILLAKEYSGKMPEKSIPNVVSYSNGLVDKMERKPYQNNPGEALHTGACRLTKESLERIKSGRYSGDIEGELFSELIEKRDLSYTGPVDTWKALKIPEHIRELRRI